MPWRYAPTRPFLLAMPCRYRTTTSSTTSTSLSLCLCLCSSACMQALTFTSSSRACCIGYTTGLTGYDAHYSTGTPFRWKMPAVNGIACASCTRPPAQSAASQMPRKHFPPKRLRQSSDIRWKRTTSALELSARSRSIRSQQPRLLPHPVVPCCRSRRLPKRKARPRAGQSGLGCWAQ